MTTTLDAPPAGRGRPAVRPTGVERTFATDELIVSKTDRRGVITYANDVFLRVGAYRLDEVIGQPHNLIRHPEMPRAVFVLRGAKPDTGFAQQLQDGSFFGAAAIRDQLPR